MTVRELIKALQKQNPESSVFLSADEEGNDFKPVDYCAEFYAADGFATSAGEPIEGVIVFPVG
jgi:hypothetical protein